MKKIIVGICIMFFPILTFGDMTFPDSVSVVDVQTGFKIMLGLTPRFVEREYAPSNEKRLLRRYSSGIEIWSVTYDDFRIIYETFDMTINTIEIKTNRFRTSNGITIGDPLVNVIKAYGNPTDIQRGAQGELFFVFRHDRFREINDYSEFTQIQFTIINNRVYRIFLSIRSWA